MKRGTCIGHVVGLACALASARATAQETVPVATGANTTTPPRIEAPRPPVPESGGQVESGWAFEVHFGNEFTIVDTSSGQSFGSLAGGFSGGYKLGRTMFGLGFEIARVASSSSTAGTQPGSSFSSGRSATSMLVMPGIRVALARTADLRVEIYGQVDIGLGRWFSDSWSDRAGSTSTNDTSNFRVVYQVGPGVRYWLHPHLALGAAALLRGDFSFTSTTSSGNSTGSDDMGVTTIDGAIQLLGVF